MCKKLRKMGETSKKAQKDYIWKLEKKIEKG